MATAPSSPSMQDLQAETNGDQYLVDTNLVDDPVYLQTPWITALHFKKEPDGSKWDPSTCDARFLNMKQRFGVLLLLACCAMQPFRPMRRSN